MLSLTESMNSLQLRTWESKLEKQPTPPVTNRFSGPNFGKPRDVRICPLIRIGQDTVQVAA
ncbi:MAG: hypothetical protein CMM07_17320 [Rhodopirellula sp.]|nr:hypothetical protein [Rhodopirellula sp.]